MEVRISARFAPDEEVLADLARVAAQKDSATLTRAAYDDRGQFSSSMVVRRFGGWRRACDLAGLAWGRPDLGHDDDDWMQNILDVWTELGRQPTYSEMKGSGFSPGGHSKRYGSWTNALLQFQQWTERSASQPE